MKGEKPVCGLDSSTYSSSSLITLLVPCHNCKEIPETVVSQNKVQLLDAFVVSVHLLRN
jgi:hypothetical protein